MLLPVRRILNPDEDGTRCRLMLESVRRKLDRDPVRERLCLEPVLEILCRELVRMRLLESFLDKLPRKDPCRERLLRELLRDKLWRELFRLKLRREPTLERLRRDPEELSEALDDAPPFLMARRSNVRCRFEALDALVETPDAIFDIGLSIERR